MLNKENNMLKLERKKCGRRNLINGARRLARNLVLGGTILYSSHAALAAAVVNSFSYTFRAPMTNSGVDPDARGTVQGSLVRRGATDNQRLTITATKLDSSATYHLSAFLDDSASATAVSDLQTTAHGASSVNYVKSSRPGAHPLPSVIDPITELRELDIANTNGDTVLGADIRDPSSFSYSVRRAMDNTGAPAGASGVLRLTGSPRRTAASVTATGLTPLTSYQLVVNGVGTTTKTSTKQGKLTINGPKTGLPLVLDVRTVALADGTGTIIVLSVSGLGIPSAGSTAGPGPVVLGSARTYAVLAGSTVTSTGATTVTGDLGVSPGTAVTGFPPGTVNGAIHAGDAAAAQAQLDLTTAYNDAAGRTLAPVSVAGNISGQTLAPGLYKSTSSLEISSGDLTLDAQGDASAVFIFQIASTLTTTSGRQVILSGGAQAANIFWQVGSSATLGSTSVFKGTIMADQSITLNTGATLDGRALARIAAVTLQGNTIRLATTSDTIRPSVSSTAPANAATGVALNRKIAATFSEAMDASTVNTNTFTVKQGTTPVAGTVTYAGTTATFTPASPLASSSAYTATITTGAKDLAGNAVANAFGWSFTTGLTADTTAPTVSSSQPANGATSVALNQKVAATFDEAMDPSTIGASFTLKQGTTLIPGAVTYAAVGTTATFTPATNLAPSTVYTATITTAAKDLAGNALTSDVGWSFTTGATPDTNQPVVLASVPTNSATAVGINQAVNVTFSKAMDPATISTATFFVTGPGTTNVIGTVGYDVNSRIATFTPSANLATNTLYRATVTTSATDLAGNPLATNVVWSFTTAGSTAGQAPIVLGSATTFAVLAGSTATSVGNTIINGDLGVSPGTAVTGFGPGVINGSTHAGDSVSAQAELDLTTAYNDAAGRTLAPITVSGNLGGQTLAPGLYKSTSSLEVSSGDLTLDAQGDANAVFIFQIASTLTTTAGRQVILSGGAKAANIFWQVGSSATFGSTSVFKGTVMADQAITLTTGATLEGRALAHSAAVTMDSNSITIPAP